MTVFLYIISTILIIAGLSFVAKARNPTTAKMGKIELFLLCSICTGGGVVAIIIQEWLPIFITFGFVWIIYGYNEYRRRNKKPILSPEDYNNPEIVDKFLDWWLSNDPQVNEIRKSSTQAIWQEGHHHSEIDSDISINAEEYFRRAIKERLSRLQKASEVVWIKELETTGQKSFAFVKEAAEIGEAYGIEFDKFDFRNIDKQINEKEDNRKFKKAFLLERLLANQRRILMWQFHKHFGRWYTPQS